jgi:hypothetical protein
VIGLTHQIDVITKLEKRVSSRLHNQYYYTRGLKTDLICQYLLKNLLLLPLKDEKKADEDIMNMKEEESQQQEREELDKYRVEFNEKLSSLFGVFSKIQEETDTSYLHSVVVDEKTLFEDYPYIVRKGESFDLINMFIDWGKDLRSNR